MQIEFKVGNNKKYKLNNIYNNTISIKELLS